MQKLFLQIFIVLIIVSALMVGVFSYLAFQNPYQPGDAFYDLQNSAQDFQLALIRDPLSRSNFLVKLIDQRLLDLAMVTGTPYELEVLLAINEYVDQLLKTVNQTGDSQAVTLQADLEGLFSRLENVLFYLSNTREVYPDILAYFEKKITAIQDILHDPNRTLASLDLQADPTRLILPGLLNDAIAGNQANVANDPFAIDPLQVPFLPGSAGAEHAFFPLVGAHAALECSDCHSPEQYSGLTPECETCHMNQMPPNHFVGACSSCHNVSSWLEVNFDHPSANAVDCTSCHGTDKPANHFTGQCSACHTTTSWRPAHFDHQVAGATNCLTCHGNDRPAAHFDGQCSSCHNTQNWNQATFNHQAAGANNCQNCHSSDRPANHFTGQCSLCHVTDTWRQASFNHQAMGATDCIACHISTRPANHFDGQCSACHNTSRWSQAVFNHEVMGASDCQTCHNADRPANHFSGQCSQCHGTGGWRPARFDHQAAGAVDCQSCHVNDRPANHFSGQCSQCHDTSRWGSASFNHQAAGATDCQSCHTRPSNHFSGQCSQCHDTSSWSSANFNHRFPINHKNANGDCSKCHPSGPPAWTCYTCHDQSETERHHEEKNILDIARRCTDCHPDGSD